MRMRTSVLWATAALGLALWAAIGRAAPAKPGAAGKARHALQVSGCQGGLVVLVGCGDADFLAALRASDAYLVCGLDTDPAKVAAARKQLQAKGLLGPVSVDTWDGTHLPVVSNLANLIVVPKSARVPQAEAMRILAPGGTALAGAEAGGWTKTVKPRPDSIGEWTHWLHDADGNAVARDKTVGPPRHLQWRGRPMWLRHHNATIGVSAMVSARGRLFYILDESPIGTFGLPPRWSLIARDAFNGVVLWKRPIDGWGWNAWVGPGSESRSRFDQPIDTQRQLVAKGGSVYVPLGAGKPLAQLDAATGNVVRTFPGTQPLSEVIVTKDTLVASLHRPSKPAGDDKNALLAKSILAFDLENGKRLWQQNGIAGQAGKTNALRKLTAVFLTATGSRLYHIDGGEIVCRDIRSGKEQWRAPRPPRKPGSYGYASLYMPDRCTLVALPEVLLLAQTDATKRIPWNEPVPATLIAYDAQTGKEKWQHRCGNWSYGSPADVFVIDHTARVHAPKGFELMGVDVATGKVKRTWPTDKALNCAHHHRCYRNKATTRYILTARRGIELIDPRTGEIQLHHWVRGSCMYGVMPCNGMLYVPPDPCMCYDTAKVNGLLALAPERAAYPSTPDDRRLVPGPAFGGTTQNGKPTRKQPKTPGAAAGISDPGSQISDLRTQIANVGDDWPAYRGDGQRSGASPRGVGDKLVPCWRTKVGTGLSSVTVAGGMVFVASRDSGVVHALDGATGRIVWSFATGGAVDSPPTYVGGTVLFGSADGRVYCVRAADGELVWRFQAAPADVRITEFGRMSSPWPVHGSVLVRDGTAYVAAGRSSFLDGGIRLYALDAATGKVRDRHTLYTPDPKTNRGTFDATLRYDMPPDHSGAVSDILVSQGPRIYMRQVQLDPKDLSKDFGRGFSARERKAFYKKQGGRVLQFGPQMTSTAGLLDDSWFNQTFWSYQGRSQARLLVCDAKATYGLKAYGGRPSRHTRSKFTVGKSTYTLFADAHATGKRLWSLPVPIRVSGMAIAGDTLIAAGAPARPDTKHLYPSFEGQSSGLLWVVSAKAGKKLTACELPSAPVWDGLAAAGGRVYFADRTGHVACWAAPANGSAHAR